MSTLTTNTTWTDPRVVYGGNGSGTIGIMGSAGITKKGLTMNDLQHEVFATPVDTLLNLWLTKFGNEWVDLVDIQRDDFYTLAYERLKALGQIEMHYLTDRSRYVCRKPQ